MFTKHTKGLLTLTLATFLSTSLCAKSDEDMVKSIMNLRGDVESLYTQIDENKEAYKAQMKSLALQKADTDAQMNRKSTSIKLADLELQKVKLKIANTTTQNYELKPLINEVYNTLESSIKSGIPFKVAGRLNVIKKIKNELAQNSITQERALAQLWASYDDNIRLTKEIGIFKQNIEIDSKQILAQVAKLGSVMLYFQTPDKRFGYATKQNDSYAYKVVTNEEDVKKIKALFDALNKQIRTGYFTLPNALVLQGDK
jgi:hypothetical protein